MNPHYLLLVIFLTSFSLGWLAKGRAVKRKHESLSRWWCHTLSELTDELNDLKEKAKRSNRDSADFWKYSDE